MLFINGVYAASWIYTGQSASPTTRSDQEPNNHYHLTQSTPDAFASLVTSAELTPVRIILGRCTPVLLVYPSTGGEDPAGLDRPGYELSRMIYGHSIWVWWQLHGVLRTEQLGRHSWKWLCCWQALDDDDNWFDWSFAPLTSPVVTATSIILSANKIQNGNILATDCPGKWPSMECHCRRHLWLWFTASYWQSPTFGQYQTVLLSNGGMSMSANCPRWLDEGEQLGVHTYTCWRN